MTLDKEEIIECIKSSKKMRKNARYWATFNKNKYKKTKDNLDLQISEDWTGRAAQYDRMVKLFESILFKYSD